MAKTKPTVGESGLTAADLVAAMQEAEEEKQRLAAKAARPGMLRQSRTTAFRLRRQLVPHTVVGLLWVGANAARLLPDSTVNAAAVYFVLAVVWWVGWGRRRNTGGNRKWRRRYTTLVMFCGGAWLLWAVADGAGGWRAATLWLGGFALAAPHWRRNRLRIPAKDAPPPIWTPEPHALLTATQEDWNEHIGGPGRFLDGSRLGEHEKTHYGEAYNGQLVRGKQKLSTVTANIDLICSGLDRDLDEVVIDRHPLGGQARFRIKIIDRAHNPMHRTLPYPGPTYDAATGAVRLGTYADSEPTNFQLHVPGSGVFGGTVIGGTGAGKSRLLEGLASSAAHSGLYVVWVIDPQGGKSLPAWAKHADWAATEPDEIRRMLRAAERILEWRSKVDALEERGHFDPTPELPGLLLIIDEAHKILISGSEETEIATILAREGRKSGIAEVVADQYPGLPTFGNSEPLRSSLQFRNSIVMRTASRSSKGIIPGLAMDPFDLPATPGAAYTVSVDGSGKTAPFKAFLVEDPMYWAQTAPRTTLDRVSAAAAGDDYLSRHRRREQAREALRAEVEALRTGAITITSASRTTANRASSAGQPARTGTATAAVTVATPKMPHDTDTGAVAKVLGVLDEGARRTGEIIELSGYSETWVRTMLKSLISTGKVTRVAHGEYELTDLGSRYLQTTQGSADTALLQAAIETVVTERTASTALLQRTLRVSLAQAGQLMDALERLDIIGPGTGLKAREVLVSDEDLPEALDRAHTALVA